MNSERFNSALDGISDDLIDAAAGAYEKKANRKKTFIRVAWAACALLVLTAIGLFWKAPAGVIDPTQPTISMENPTTAPTKPTEKDIIVHTGNVYFLSATGDTPIMTPVQANMTLPMDHIFRVRSLKGMTAHEKYLAKLEEIAFVCDFQEKYSNLVGEWRTQERIDDNFILQHLSGGLASVIIMDNSQVESVERETTGILRVGRSYSIYLEDDTIGKGESAVTIPKGCKRIYLDCDLSNEMQKIFEENPDTPLSTIKDTITITINYKNGTKEIVVIDVTVDDDGQIYMTQRGDNTGV